MDEDFTYYPDAGDHLRGSTRFDPRPNLGWSGVELFSPRRPALPSRFSHANPLHQSGRSPQVEVERVERVDEDFTYYRDDEPAPQWGTTEEISEEILAHNPERTFGNPVQTRRNTEVAEEVGFIFKILDLLFTVENIVKIL